MRKKLSKYIKFTLCIILILSLVAPSYAALQSTDGAVFVTKAEFDSSMADFNSILTTFESSINSTIDSQVTSYLDKNGVWAPRSQINLKPEGWAWDFVNYTRKNGTGNVTYERNDVFVASKTGLCNMRFVYKINKTGTEEDYVYTWGDLWRLNSAGTSICVFNSIEAWYIIKDGTEQVIAFNVLGGTPKLGRTSDSDPDFFPIWTKVATTTEYPVVQLFFVDQGHTYGIEMKQYYYMDTTYVAERRSTYKGRMQVKNLSFDIY